MKTLRELVRACPRLSELNASHYSYIHEADVRDVCIKYAAEVIDWLLEQTRYEREWDTGQGEMHFWWGGKGDRMYSSEDLVEQYNKIPIIEQK